MSKGGYIKAMKVEEIAMRWHFFVDCTIEENDIATIFLNIKKIYPHSRHFMSADTIHKAILEANKKYDNPEEIIRVGEVLIDDPSKKITFSIRRSFTWEIDIIVQPKKMRDIPFSDAIGNSIEEMEGCKTLLCGFIREEVVKLIKNSLLSSSFTIDLVCSNSDFGKMLEEIKSDETFAMRIGLPEGRTSIVDIDENILLSIIHTKHEIPYWGMHIIRKRRKVMWETGQPDYLYSLLRISLTRDLMKKQIERLKDMELMIKNKNAIIEKIIRGEISLNDRDTRDLLGDLFHYRSKINEINIDAANIIQYRNFAAEKISKFNEVEIRGSAYGNIRRSVSEVEGDMNMLFSEIVESLNSTEQIINDFMRHRTVDGMEKSIKISTDMVGVLEASHSMHMAMFILEFVLFAEFFTSLFEHIELYKHLSTEYAIGVDIIAIFAGIFCAFILTRVALQFELAKKLFGFAAEREKKRRGY